MVLPSSDKPLIRLVNYSRRWVLPLLVLMLSAMPAGAATYVLPAKDDVIGQVQYTRAAGGERLSEIARRYGVGIAALKAANPGIDPQHLQKDERITIPSRYILPKGPREGIVINIAEMRLYHYTKPEEGPPLVSTYPVSIGRQGKAAALGSYIVSQRVRKPTWEAGGKMIPPGPKNPLGEYAMSFDKGDCQIHGTNEPYSIGMKVNAGCVRLYPEEMEILVHRTVKETPVRIINEPFKHGYKNGVLYFEIHKPENASGGVNLAALVNKVTDIVPHRMWADDWQRVKLVGETANGIATPVMRLRNAGKPPRGLMLQVATYKSYASARKLMLQLEALDLPLSTRGCETDKCVVFAGPFSDREYMENLMKRIKWITRIKSQIVPYAPEADPLEEVAQKVAGNDGATG